jgi:sulfide:quinone oxidoreductase
VAVLNDGSEMPYALFLGVPVHRAPAVVVASGMAVNGWVPVDKQTLATQIPGRIRGRRRQQRRHAQGRRLRRGRARVAAAGILAQLQGGEAPAPYAGAGSCYVEFGNHQVGRVDVNFLGGPKPTGTFSPPSDALVAEKEHFGSSRALRWFGREWTAKG